MVRTSLCCTVTSQYTIINMIDADVYVVQHDCCIINGSYDTSYMLFVGMELVKPKYSRHASSISRVTNLYVS